MLTPELSGSTYVVSICRIKVVALNIPDLVWRRIDDLALDIPDISSLVRRIVINSPEVPDNVLCIPGAIPDLVLSVTDATYTLGCTYHP